MAKTYSYVAKTYSYVAKTYSYKIPRKNIYLNSKATYIIMCNEIKNLWGIVGDELSRNGTKSRGVTWGAT